MPRRSPQRDRQVETAARVYRAMAGSSGPMMVRSAAAAATVPKKTTTASTGSGYLRRTISAATPISSADVAVAARAGFAAAAYREHASGHHEYGERAGDREVAGASPREPSHRSGVPACGLPRSRQQGHGGPDEQYEHGGPHRYRHRVGTADRHRNQPVLGRDRQRLTQRARPAACSITRPRARVQQSSSPIVMLREDSSDDNPTASTVVMPVVTATARPHWASTAADGASPAPAKRTTPVAVMAKDTMARTPVTTSAAGTRTANSAIRERPVDARSRKTPAAVSPPPAAVPIITAATPPR